MGLDQVFVPSFDKAGFAGGGHLLPIVEVHARLTATGPQLDVSIQRDAVEADPLDLPELVLGSADTLSQRTVCTSSLSSSGLKRTVRTMPNIARKVAKDAGPSADASLRP